METLLIWSCYFTLFCFALAGVILSHPLFVGPTPQDRVLGIDTLYLIGMMIALTLGMLYRTSWYFDIGLLVSLFGFLSTAAMARFLLRGEVIEP
ncbi:K+/H+ antiporter subunit F [Advenella sp. S44]|uniref:K+/H+ antiporter subunit F n=1 Tax=Advenella kashmirensis TaxID=310575 RepID=A0A356LGU3_9BURK|nr:MULTISPECIES: K+/H+ antiporter subunit F [unclassified Advenella]PJX23736.1 K+/H+ antiporter subunit F [Advenella sp. S44]HBP30230.1 K+/H+ antiporter subunit F [Advenella kashmirensis]